MCRSPWILIALCILLGVGLVGAPTSTMALPIRPAAVRYTTPRPAGPTDPVELAAFLNDYLPAQLAEQHIAGAAVAVVKDGELLFANGYGYANLAQRTPVIADQTIFATGSAGKLFTWMAVMQQVEQGILDLDTDVNTYLDFSIPATYPEPITLRHLLSHTAGFDDLAGIYSRHPHELVAHGHYLASHIPVRVRHPGELASYSNYGAALAGYIVERTAGIPFEQYIEEYLFNPLAMQQSTFRQPLPENLADMASTGYQYINGEYQVVPTVAIRLPAAGASYTTVTDMAHFMIAHLQQGRYGAGQVLQEATARQMHQQLFAHDPRVGGMAYGFAEVTLNQQHILKHNGAIPGSFNTLLALLPEQRLGIYVSYNTGGATPGEQLVQAFIDHYYPVEQPAPIPVADMRQVTAQMVGTYRSTRTVQTTFAKVLSLVSPAYADIQVVGAPDGSVTTSGLGAQPIQWLPVAHDMLRLADGRQDSYGDLVFGADAAGSFTRLYVQNNPYRAYERIPWYETRNVFFAVLGICTLIFLSAVLAWPIAAIRRRYRQADRTPQLALWLAAAASAMYLLFLVGLVLSIGEALDQGPTALLIALLSLPLLASVLLAGSCMVARRSWPLSCWSRLLRGQYLLVVVAGFSYIWLLNTWNLLGFRL